jgi:hypothetical protein
MEQRMRYMVSADFGQTTDYTAVAVTRRRLELVGEKYNYEGLRCEGDLWSGQNMPFTEVRQDVEQHYELIRLERVDLHTRYTAIAKGIVKLIREFGRLHRKEDGLEGRPRVRIPIGLVIDEGGVGKAVKDILREAIRDGIPNKDGEPYVNFIPVTVHGGANTSISGGYAHVPKRDLVHAGIVSYQNGTLKVGKLQHRPTLEKELQNYRLKQNLSTGYAAFEPLREGEHDDLLFATCLACWAWERAIDRVEYRSFPGEWLLEAPVTA